MKADTLEDLVKQAQRAQKRAYAPYSKYGVGAALLGASGKIYWGVNVENASYGLTMCAERSAIFAGVASGETSSEDSSGVVVSVGVSVDTGAKLNKICFIQLL